MDFTDDTQRPVTCAPAAELGTHLLIDDIGTMQAFMPAAPFAALCLLASPWTPAPADVFLSVATFLNCMSLQFHVWAHMKKSELPPIVDRLQV